MGALRVRFDDPGDGWIGLRLETADAVFERAFSDTPYDSFFDLVTLLSLLVEGDGDGRVRFFVGSPEFHVRLSRRGAVATLEVEEFPTTPPGTSRGEVVFRAAGGPDDLLRPFWRGLRDLATRFQPDDLEQRLHRPFPFDALDRLTARLQPVG